MTFDSYGASGGSGHQFTVNHDNSTLEWQIAGSVSWANTNSYCGDADWELNTPKSVLGKTCGGSTYWSAGTDVYGAYLLDGSQLFWDESNSAYPTSLDFETSDNYTKQ